MLFLPQICFDPCNDKMTKIQVSEVYWWDLSRWHRVTFIKPSEATHKLAYLFFPFDRRISFCLLVFFLCFEVFFLSRHHFIFISPLTTSRMHERWRFTFYWLRWIFFCLSLVWLFSLPCCTWCNFNLSKQEEEKKERKLKCPGGTKKSAEISWSQSLFCFAIKIFM